MYGRYKVISISPWNMILIVSENILEHLSRVDKLTDKEMFQLGIKKTNREYRRR